MRIGVFGDSFADRTCSKIWWRYLQSDYGHEVQCFGEAGSSLSFSMEMLDNHAHQFDKLIWCFTSVNRISFWYKDRIYHNTGVHRPEATGDPILDQKLRVIHDYISLAFDWPLQERFGKALLPFMLSKFHNLTIIPCFGTPVYFMEEQKFNLYRLCQLETENLFPNKNSEDIINSNIDQRQGHITDTNQKILAELINRDLNSKIFDTAYENFIVDPRIYQEFIGQT